MQYRPYPQAYVPSTQTIISSQVRGSQAVARLQAPPVFDPQGMNQMAYIYAPPPPPGYQRAYQTQYQQVPVYSYQMYQPGKGIAYPAEQMVLVQPTIAQQPIPAQPIATSIQQIPTQSELLPSRIRALPTQITSQPDLKRRPITTQPIQQKAAPIISSNTKIEQTQEDEVSFNTLPPFTPNHDQSPGIFNIIARGNFPTIVFNSEVSLEAN